ncbi:MAG: hypothetical protein M1828_000306 [Chrysothrix sp. TS-e1954]|nr:MAG: hypothetical protein M1828_000306 [Chrysothrix sp. TS-e1954]
MPSPPRHNAIPPLPQPSRDAHANSYPIPPLHQQSGSYSGNNSSRAISPNRRAMTGAAGVAAAVPVVAAADQRSSSRYSFDESPPRDPFGDDQRAMNHGYPDYPSSSVPAQQNSYFPSNALAVPAAASSASNLNPFSDRSIGTPDIRPSPTKYPSGYSTAYGNDSRGNIGSIDPMEIDDDGDDFNLPPQSRKGRGPGVTSAAGAGGAGGFLRNFGSRDTSGNYGSVPGGAGGNAEKGVRPQNQKNGGKRLKWMVIVLIGLVIVLAIIGGTIGATLSSRGASSTPSSDAGKGPDLNEKSSAIKSLANNKDLHKIFPGIDYTPLNSQYPDCLANPPLQNNVTMDVAVLSQLTPQIRLYGTDCNQTEMVLHALDALNIKNDVKVWMGVWLDTNKTTNARQLAQMYDVFDKSGADPFAGVIIGNEVLFRKDMSEAQLVEEINNIRSNLTSKNIKVPVATSDLGSNWNTQIADAVDAVMSNIHPFFGGVAVHEAAAWTYSFWQNNDVAVAPKATKQVIAEVGWPSEGGNDCGDNSKGDEVKCENSTDGAVAGIDEMNTFLEDWACQALSNGTQYFWFEAFDEPWKIQYDTPGEGWEDHWGLFDVNRKLKSGLKIPDCGGKEASLP